MRPSRGPCRCSPRPAGGGRLGGYVLARGGEHAAPGEGEGGRRARWSGARGGACRTGYGRGRWLCPGLDWRPRRGPDTAASPIAVHFPAQHQPGGVPATDPHSPSVEALRSRSWWSGGLVHGRSVSLPMQSVCGASPDALLDGSLDCLVTADAHSSEREVHGCVAGMSRAGSSSRARARRPRVRQRQGTADRRSRRPMVVRLIPARPASCFWDSPRWRRNCRSRWPSRTVNHRLPGWLVWVI